MRRLVLAAALAAFGAPASADLPPDAPQVSAENVVGAFMENFNAGNVEGMASTYSDGGFFVWAENGRVVSDSKEAAVEAAKRMPAGVRIETDSTMRVVMIGSGAAEAIVPFTFYMKDEKGQENALFTGVMTMTVAPDADGVWRIVAGHMSASGRN